ncbi:hypothetical protein LX87_03306 [Larkinella arboricola]|uniref:Uncharacterized protein n=1 Tax=Larkinella arboricola TaxID=643671 RepID=A0A327X040_LARAB|nr:hypothetical protein LX87_03306 [Larkinella arboricola]
MCMIRHTVNSQELSTSSLYNTGYVAMQFFFMPMWNQTLTVLHCKYNLYIKLCVCISHTEMI